MKYFYQYLVLAAIALACCTSCSKNDNSSSGSDTGTGGSLARFTITMDHLYVVDGKNLYTFDLATGYAPVKVNTTSIGFNIETIYTWKDKLFIGSRDAMYVYSIANPGEPSLLGTASHARACDPVVATDTVAYVTVRTGTTCGGNTNALYVYDLHNVVQPLLKNTVNLNNPHGLGLQDNILYVCDGNSGLKVYNLKEAYAPVLSRTITGETFYDCIPYGDVLICMIEGGTALYDISDITHIRLLSKITG
ncbi:hypothetical protein [Taibaiella chishuiensis]|uniref:LVIVD repeat-containing protein n=1 Tax=Taibaiella chishuiensis TaxID=1434707 RepID=A0A2P8DD28_9BACT|nr:hypothetical protein [Taibaiella chishuiensis]PSK95116.1 hypothetical protein B0I18_1011280 [Taibaiella chishuiensis]